MKRAVLFGMALACTVGAGAQRLAEPKSVIGTWKGDSTCQIKESPCHDEVSVYRIHKGKGSDDFVIELNKVVDGQEVLFGTIDCPTGRASGTTLCRTNGDTLWGWKLEGDVLSGRLLYKGALYRLIHLERVK